MRQKIISILIILAIIDSNILFAAPYLGEKGLVVTSGLTNDLQEAAYESKNTEKFKTYFDRSDKEIIYWITVDLIQLKNIATIQSVEWYSPDGKVWFKEIRDSLSTSARSALGAKSVKKEAVFILKTNDIPENLGGVWAVRFIWNDNVVDERYFSFDKKYMSPDDVQISELRKNIILYNKGIEASNRDSIFKLESFLSYGSKDPYHIQKINKPRISFRPTDKIKYTLNIEPRYLGSYDLVYMFLFSPDGKVKKKSLDWPYRPNTMNRPSALFTEDIDFKKILNGEDAHKYLGLWKIQTHYLKADMKIDERYFYLDLQERITIDSQDIKKVDEKASRDEVLSALDKGERRTIEEEPSSSFNKKLRETKKIKIGMSKDEIIAILGKPDHIATNQYDDAEVLIYIDPRNMIYLSRPDTIGTDLIAAGIVCAANILAAQKLKVIIKNDRVVGVNQGP